ncbi:Glycoside hydrolase 18 protein, partial [Monosporozyma unispora]
NIFASSVSFDTATKLSKTTSLSSVSSKSSNPKRASTSTSTTTHKSSTTTHKSSTTTHKTSITTQKTSTTTHKSSTITRKSSTTTHKSSTRTLDPVVAKKSSSSSKKHSTSSSDNDTTRGFISSEISNSDLKDLVTSSKVGSFERGVTPSINSVFIPYTTVIWSDGGPNEAIVGTIITSDDTHSKMTIITTVVIAKLPYTPSGMHPPSSSPTVVIKISSSFTPS